MYTATKTSAIIIIACIVFNLIYRNICGSIASKIANRRELDDNGFFWGFFLGILGIIIMRCCPED